MTNALDSKISKQRKPYERPVVVDLLAAQSEGKTTVTPTETQFNTYAGPS